MIAARTALMDGELADTRNNGLELADSPPLRVRPLPVPPFIPPLRTGADPSLLIPRSIVPADTSTSTTPVEGTHSNGPAIVEPARSIASPPATAGDAKPHELPPVTVTGTADGRSSIPWVPILIVLGVAFAVIVAAKIFGKRV